MLFLKATPAQEPLPAELQERIVALLPLRDLKALCAHPRMIPTLRVHLKQRVIETLDSFRLKGQETLDMMSASRTVLSGSAALEIVSPGSCEPNNLNFYCPVGSAHHALSAILATKGFVETPMSLKTLMSERSPFNKFEVNNGVKRLYRLVHLPTKKTIILAESISASPLAPILFFHSTLMMNYVTGTTAISLYPDLTYERKGFLNYAVNFAKIHRPDVLDRWTGVGMSIWSDCHDLHDGHPSMSPTARKGMCQWAYRQINDDWADRMAFQRSPRLQLGPVLAWRLGHRYRTKKDVMHHKTSVHLVHEEWFKLCMYKKAVEWVRYYVPLVKETGLIDQALWKRSFPN
ncbi:hypothetical protein DFP72DRAFT_82574 [Ephemerocybe angulata]|uniref:Uncharacterized protein n=1 Tax=Ephemerocybe angulata TaxID=980116 RepID=A0A8H6LVM9_9AGAR|nr:hypothetical protein DFP72DRAFT_82574 [Tulosesus angulatus]